MRCLFFAFLLLASAHLPAGKRDDQVNADKASLEKQDRWIYNDLEAGLAEAKKTGKPLFVVLRCVP